MWLERSYSVTSLIVYVFFQACLSAKKSNPQADTTALEREIDHLVYDLYGLTEDEIKIVEGGKVEKDSEIFGGFNT
ncbi:MAG: hypothetical protein MJZ29_08195 [Bacteroidaceae bacterium]|nr:hypothetical protein [Bacteroidaceae bacterium]